jgi:hypothetical protein
MGFTLKDVKQGTEAMPPRIIIYGPGKVGKTTFAAGGHGVKAAPNSILLPTEEGFEHIDCPHFPLCNNFDDFLSALESLATEEHSFQHLIIDSADWLEPLIWEDICRRKKADSIETVCGGYGKGYVEALKEWRRVIQCLEYLRKERGMGVIIICHDEPRQVTPADSDPYNIIDLKLHRRAGALLREWADAIGYAQLKKSVKEVELGFNKTAQRAVSVGGKRELIFGAQPSLVTGNRYGLGTIPLSWKAFVKARQ